MVMSLKLSQFNGYGCIDQVNQRQTVAPMCYRVLLPWLVWAFERFTPLTNKQRFTTIYTPFRILMTGLALWAVAQAFNPIVALLVAAILPLTFRFDYWDWAVELFAVAGALTGQFWLALIGAVILALSRETAPLVAAAYWLMTGDWYGTLIIGGCTASLMLIVRLWADNQPLNCDRFMIRANLADVRNLFQNRPFYLGEIGIALIITALTLLAIVFQSPGWPIAALALVVGWMLARAAETKVFVICLPWCAQILLKTGGF